MEAARNRGAVVFVVAQRTSILNRADRLIVLKDGVVTHMGDRQDVMAALGPTRRTLPEGERPAAALPKEAGR